MSASPGITVYPVASIIWASFGTGVADRRSAPAIDQGRVNDRDRPGLHLLRPRADQGACPEDHRPRQVPHPFLPAAGPSATTSRSSVEFLRIRSRK